MPVRTLNYTKRKRILREDALIWVQEGNGHPAFRAELRLWQYGFPAEAPVYVEAYRQARYMRFPWGKAGELEPHPQPILHDFESPDGVLFRVKVVAVDGREGLILGEADQIRPKHPDEEANDSTSLLPVVGDPRLGDQVWRLEFDPPQVLLKVNARLGDWRSIASDPAFAALVYPTILRQILHYIYRDGSPPELDDPDDWRAKWIQLVDRIPGTGEPPAGDTGGQLQGQHGEEDYIEDAVAAFCRHYRIGEVFGSYWKGGGGN